MGIKRFASLREAVSRRRKMRESNDQLVNKLIPMWKDEPSYGTWEDSFAMNSDSTDIEMVDDAFEIIMNVVSQYNGRIDLTTPEGYSMYDYLSEGENDEDDDVYMSLADEAYEVLRSSFQKQKMSESSNRFRPRKKLKENIEGDIYNRYQVLIDEGYSDREARYQLTEEFGPSEEDDNYAAMIDSIESGMGVDDYNPSIREGQKKKR